MSKREQPIKATNVFLCPNCAGNPQFDNPQAFKEHLAQAHNISEPKGKRTMTMHLDGSDYFASDYEWEIGGLKFYQSTCNPRSKADAAYWH